MVSVRNTLGDSIRAMLGIKPPPPSPEAVATIREAMLQLLGEDGHERHPQLHTRLHQIHDAQGLWHMRVELYAHLCEQYDEPHARDCLAALLPLFKGQVPRALLDSASPGAGPDRSR
ncbi:hypothetical protein [Hydrogenophaga sp.]|jgi:hypothetical protein|uniref:hypothetical protein n=1 Tax=Hydrogenophaga sp. TaxID=1904254 RepID=UPI00260B86CE|nr:hypothetical protein [Hydrogenophaga sp.]MDM7949760.1 hypothetical protein [Hydrogenophaga sp.]